MIQLFLDGKPAIPSENQTIKLTTENSFFSKSATYTYDIDLPLALTENQRIFGFIHRMDLPKEPRNLSAVFIVDNVTILSGTAHITSVTETSVKVQLLGEAASYNYGNKMDDTYIDKLDLGDWFMSTWPDGSHWAISGEERWYYYPEDSHFKGTASMVFDRARFTDDGRWSDNTLFGRIYNGEYPWVAYPVINSTADVKCNGYAYRFADAERKTLNAFWRGYSGQRGRSNSREDIEADPVITSSAIQPFVWIMAEKIAAATGFTLDRDDNALYTNPFFRRIFIVNANNMIECNKCLPHWSVNDWWTQVENTFGLVLKIDYAGKKLFLVQRSDHYRQHAATVCLKNVVDEYSSDIDDETQTDISVNNVGFADFDANPADLLDEYIMTNSDVNSDFDSITELLAWGKSQSDMTAYKGTIFKCKDGRHYIFTEAEGIVEVNQFRPRLSEGTEDVEVELKFVPARFVDAECDFFDYITPGSGATGHTPKDVPIGSFPVKMLQVPDISEMGWYKNGNYSDIDIERILNEEEDESNPSDDKADVIYMAILPTSPGEDITASTELTTGGTYSGTIWHPRPRLRARVKASLSDANPTTEDPLYSLSLISIDGLQNLAANTIDGSIVIDAKVRQCIKFVADTIPDPTSIFLIHNRRFVCEKIEADIVTDGLRKLLTGYFYEIKL